jgi:hypothetical protein
MKICSNVIIMSLACLLWHSANAQIQGAGPENPAPKTVTIDVVKHYTATGWMGDGTNGTKYVQIDEVCKSNVRPNRQTCVKIAYSVGPATWAGMYWQNKPDNWGDKPGDDFSARSFKKVSFWAKGEKGDEVVEFKCGGISADGKSNKDSFEATTGTITLEKNWKRYEINIEGLSLSSVIGVFCWSASETFNPTGLTTFYLDEIQYE